MTKACHHDCGFGGRGPMRSASGLQRIVRSRKLSVGGVYYDTDSVIGKSLHSVEFALLSR